MDVEAGAVPRLDRRALAEQTFRQNEILRRRDLDVARAAFDDSDPQTSPFGDRRVVSEIERAIALGVRVCREDRGIVEALRGLGTPQAVTRYGIGNYAVGSSALQRVTDRHGRDDAIVPAEAIDHPTDDVRID